MSTKISTPISWMSRRRLALDSTLWTPWTTVVRGGSALDLVPGRRVRSVATTAGSDAPSTGTAAGRPRSCFPFRVATSGGSLSSSGLYVAQSWASSTRPGSMSRWMTWVPRRPPTPRLDAPMLSRLVSPDPSHPRKAGARRRSFSRQARGTVPPESVSRPIHRSRPSMTFRPVRLRPWDGQLQLRRGGRLFPLSGREGARASQHHLCTRSSGTGRRSPGGHGPGDDRRLGSDCFGDCCRQASGPGGSVG